MVEGAMVEEDIVTSAATEVATGMGVILATAVIADMVVMGRMLGMRLTPPIMDTGGM